MKAEWRGNEARCSGCFPGERYGEAGPTNVLVCRDPRLSGTDFLLTEVVTKPLAGIRTGKPGDGSAVVDRGWLRSTSESAPVSRDMAVGPRTATARTGSGSGQLGVSIKDSGRKSNGVGL